MDEDLPPQKKNLVEHLEYEGRLFSNDSYFTSAGKYFKNITIPSGRGPPLKHMDYKYRMKPIIRLPFTTGPTNDYIFNTDSLDPAKIKVVKKTPIKDTPDEMKKYEYSVDPVRKDELQINEKLLEGLEEKNIFDRPVVYLVHFVIRNSSGETFPHTGICVVYRGEIYTIGYGYSIRKEEISAFIYTPEEEIKKYGTYYSPDLQIDDGNLRSVILWFGILTEDILNRLKEEINSNVTNIRFVTKPTKKEDEAKKDTVQIDSNHTITFINRRNYVDFADERDNFPNEWNCHKWALYVLFGGNDALIEEVTKAETDEVDEKYVNKRYMPYYKYPFSPIIMSYGINPLNLYRLHQAMLDENEVELKKVLEDTDKGFKIFWTIRIKKQDEAIQEEEAKQEEQAIREEQAKQEQSEVRAHNKGGKQKKKGKKSQQTKRRKSKKRPIVKRRKTQKHMRR
jgi:hypothetical protein